MEVTIKSIGHNNGSSGWLKENIENGTIFFQEGISKSGNHGLWLKQKTEGKTKSMYLAGISEYTTNEYVVEEIYLGNNPSEYSNLNIYNLTTAAARAVSKVAKKWCDEKNLQRETDEELDIIVTFKGEEK